MIRKEIIIKEVLVFKSYSVQFAIPLKFIDKVIAAQEINPVDNSSYFIKGVIDIQGEIIPVLSLRARFKLPDKDISIDDKLVIINFNNARVALVAEESCDIITFPNEEIKEIKTIFNGLSSVKLVNGKAGIIYIYDPDTFLSKDESIEITSVIAKISQSRAV
ncbi:MAG: hypothetical protein CVU13_06805 [Bacteroidetes bacterium HGW-Bacteroidetes-8]|jgi:purine-binding chemotaxis protein CheW|nr:MAG: hypothetical protein CVU13_06805 [Bacteroidetes bacterium HGW-Bacteroidetes-8]